MFIGDLLPGFIMGLREGLEAFLIIAIMLEYLRKTNRENDRKFVYQGLGIGIAASVVFGLIMFGITLLFSSGNTNIAKLWEFGSSMFALVLITTFIYFMIKNRKNIVGEITGKLSVSFTKKAIILLAAIMVAREGAEIVLFVFASADKIPYALGAFVGIVVSGLIAYLINKSLIKVNLKVVFEITLIYLILQAGFMLGYSFHELFSYFKAEGILDSSHFIYNKMFDLSDTFLYHKERPVGIILYATLGWYSKPEVFQFIIQYIYTFGLLFFFMRNRNK